MNQNLDLNFIPQLILPDESASDILTESLCFIFNHDDILLFYPNPEGSLPTSPKIPHLSEINELAFDSLQRQFFGIYKQSHCLAIDIHLENHATLPKNFTFIPLRQALELIQEPPLVPIMIRAKQILHWNKTTQFCGHCGKKTELNTKEPAKICPSCQALFYPQLSPVILALVYREREILLARAPHFASGLYSVVAGFVELGETAENTVAREVMEETGIALKNIQYFGSQSWSFPSHLMLGFTAEYDSGEIKIDPKEIADAQWFSLEALPRLPGAYSLSRKMIEHYLNKMNV